MTTAFCMNQNPVIEMKSICTNLFAAWGVNFYYGLFVFLASQINNEYYSALEKGVPYPILLVAEYFTMDGESIRWGRGYRLAGFYTHALLW